MKIRLHIDRIVTDETGTASAGAFTTALGASLRKELSRSANLIRDGEVAMPAARHSAVEHLQCNSDGPGSNTGDSVALALSHQLLVSK